MARPSRTGGKKSEAKARNASPAKGRKTTKTKRRIAPAATRAKSGSASGPSKDLKDARAQQAATAEILKVIASSPTDVQPVFEAIAASANRLLGGFSTAVSRFIDGMVHLAAFTPVNPTADAALSSAFPAPTAVLPAFVRAARGEPAQIADTEALADERLLEISRARGYRSVLFVPLMNGGLPIGMISVARLAPGTFAPHHVQLLQTFADQAVIAVENVRLFNEAKEALERQTASAEVLQVISSSPGDLKPVFDQMLAKAMLLCEAQCGFIYQMELGAMRAVAEIGVPPAFAEYRRNNLHTGGAATPADVMRATRKPAHVHDARDSEPYRSGNPNAVAGVDLGGARTVLYVPMIRNDDIVGVINVYRQEVRPFTEEQISLLENFASQAVIAIENARLFNETREALERQTATADILKVIASSPSDVQPVFEAIATSANRLIGGLSTAVHSLVDDTLHLKALTPTTPAADAALRATYPQPLSALPWGEQLRNGGIVQVHDTEVEWAALPGFRDVARMRGFRSILRVPLLRDGATIGAINVARTEAGPFADDYVQLLQTFADQAVIAIENVRLFNETQEALERQTATSEILRVISQSPTEVQPVFDAIVLAAVRLIRCDIAFFLRCETATYTAVARATSEGLQADTRTPQPTPIDPGVNFPSRAIVAKELLHLPDWSLIELPEYERRIHEVFGVKSSIYLPLLRKGECIGLLVLAGKRANIFGENEIALAESFRDQAVIAIENTRLFNEVKARTEDLSEALQQQTATADVLKVISRSVFDLDTVMNTLASSARDLCGSKTAALFLRDGDMLVGRGTSANEFVDEEYLRANPVPLNDESHMGRAVLTGIVANIGDFENNPHTKLRKFQQVMGFKAFLAVPLMREGRGVGVFALTRDEIGPFTERQVELVQSFADQAVIAIENTRLFNETQEALERQTATADILKVIASSPDDVQPVFQAIADQSKRLLKGLAGAVYTLVDDAVHLMSLTPVSPAADAHLKANFPVPLAEVPWAESARGGEIFRVIDAEEESVPRRTRDIARIRGWRSVLFVPLLSDKGPIGAISVARVEPGSFADHHVQLLQTFAAQAVIAIQNVRLFNEVQAKTRDLSEALTFQTGSASILNVIASSPTDVAPVLKAIVESACKLCEAYDAVALLRDGDYLLFGAHHGPIPIEMGSLQISRNWTPGLAVIEQKPVHIHDLLSSEGDQVPEAQRRAREFGYRTILSVPMLREKESIGVLALRRAEAHPFSDKQIALLQTFADQAVIAIGNVQLFEEVQAKTRDLSESLQFQTASSEVLKVISSSPDTLQPVLDAIVQTSRELCGSDASTIFLIRDDKFHFTAVSGDVPTHLEYLRDNPASIDEPLFGRLVRERRTLHFANVMDDPVMSRNPRTFLGGPRALLVAPLLRDGEPLGAIVLRQSHLKPFTSRQIQAIEVFADQAVIAISNVELFEEVQAKTRDLSEALVYQTGSGNILKVIASSPTDVGPVLKAIVENACELCEANDAIVALKHGDDLLFQEQHGSIPVVWARRPINRQWTAGRAVADCRPVHVHDLSAEGEEFPEGREIARRDHVRTVLSVPLLRKNESIGAIMLRRTEVQPFSDKQIALLQTFSDQAVIAIGNVRMFEQVQERTKELSISLDELRTAQDRLIQTEKLASLGQLTAGIAHEIKNPLNFVNNFSALSAELTDELNDVLKPVTLDSKVRGEVDELTGLLKGNLEKVVQHGKHADSIVKNMLLHSREGSREHRPADINSLLDESLNLAYHGARAEKGEFNITLQRDFDADAGTIELFPQEITRAFLNLIANGVYAATRRKTENNEPGFEPTLRATTKNLGTTVEIRIRDNGTGIPAEVREKMFNPFFTTKPAGEGTGLGLSMTHDIIVKQHGGRIDVATEPGQFTEFIIVLPRMAATGKAGADT